MTWFKSLTLAGRELLPIVQGGMGVGVSAHRLAGAVASQNAVGTIASVDLRHHHADLVEQTEKCNDRDMIDSANREALHREVRAALQTAQGRGLVAVNVMKAVRDHPALVRQACESGAEAIVMGAGLPLDLPEMTADFPKVALVPILSEARGVAAVLKKWMKKGRLADAVVIEHPGYAGGHLGAARLTDLHDERFDFKRVLADCHALFGELQLGRDAPRLIVAGGVGSHEQVRHWLANGADGVQVGTAFAVTHEGDAHENFKRVLIDADPDQLAEFTSVAGLPARAVPTPWLTRYLRQEGALQANTRSDPRRCSQRMDCLSQCGLRDGIAKFGQFCIDLKLAAAMRGEVGRGLFFRGASKLPFGSAMRSVRELMDYLLHGQMPTAA
ncbi:NAD(P)H-dependent flavin oxidoreductase [Achromobacter sp. NPDC058515]|uniref:NAD(P)H-dependent flavin oxidoreductase n=1 Tax=Achromobacter sp. NPDC058515 TaxID=3346533 RepID=UPI003649B286